jgi:hypothetical protein
MLFLLLFFLAGTSSPRVYAQSADTACPIVFKKDRLCASVSWVKKPVATEMPTQKDATSFTLKFWSRKSGAADGPYVVPAFPVTVTLSMPGMKMDDAPAPVVTAVPGQPGVYSVTNVLFSMAGNWIISISGKGQLSLTL